MLMTYFLKDLRRNLKPKSEVSCRGIKIDPINICNGIICSRGDCLSHPTDGGIIGVRRNRLLVTHNTICDNN
ncbi:hypothetical protein HanPI659440_Chr08g0311131 [Helianthus annuus]|nr:hypothetical protein HanPI659440_Chr08g0311131 [Helianthus annuus]